MLIMGNHLLSHAYGSPLSCLLLSNAQGWLKSLQGSVVMVSVRAVPFNIPYSFTRALIQTSLKMRLCMISCPIHYPFMNHGTTAVIPYFLQIHIIYLEFGSGQFFYKAPLPRWPEPLLRVRLVQLLKLPSS